MPAKNNIIPLLLCLCLAMALGAAFKFKHQLKRTFVRSAARYDALPPVPPKEGIAVFTASSLDRIFQDGKTLLKPDFASAASISLAKNEYESFQLVVQTKDRELNGVELKISDLAAASTGSKISPENVSWRLVGYVPTREPYYPVKYVGLWPDPLLPAGKIDIRSNQTQPFWITVYAPPDTAPGDYQGNITVMAEGKIIQCVPISVHVYDFVLPVASHLKTAFDLYGHLTPVRYPQAGGENVLDYRLRIKNLNDKFILAMLQYRMDPILNVDPTNQMELADVDRYLVEGLNNFSIGKRGGTFDNNWPQSDASIDGLFTYFRTYGEDLKLNDMLQYTYIYAWDEGKMGNPQVAKVASMIHRAYPPLKVMVCYHGIWDTRDGLDWIKDIDIWSFQIDDFDEPKIRRLQALGKEIWMYVSSPADRGTPNLALDFDPIDYRIIPWLCWKYDIKGFLYWCVNWWPLVDPFKDARNANWDENGNGLLFYPGKDGPIASLRAELFRDGMEDYEYIQLLFEKLKILKEKNLVKKYQEYFDESVKLLTMDDSLAASMSQFTKDGGTLDQRRNAIARQIVKFNSLPGI